MQRLKYLLICIFLCINSLAQSQGVPVNDTPLITRIIQQLGLNNQNNIIQNDRRSNNANSLQVDDAIIAQLDLLIEAGSLPQVSTQESYTSLEQGSGDTNVSANNLYNPNEQNSVANQAFGDASQNIEQIIIKGAADTYASAGVSKAGLSQAQWRALVQAMIWQESRFNPFIGSPVGAYGLTQLMPDTARELGVYPEYKTNPYVQVKGGATYLSRMLNMFNGDIVLALAAYNAGAGNVKKHHGVPPFRETQNYVVVIPKKYNEYLARMGGADSLGTIEVNLSNNANVALASNDARLYGDYNASTIALIAKRLKNIIQEMKANENPTKAWALNTYARAEVARILALRMRLAAIQSRQVSAQALELAAIRAQENNFFTFEGTRQ